MSDIDTIRVAALGANLTDMAVLTVPEPDTVGTSLALPAEAYTADDGDMSAEYLVNDTADIGAALACATLCPGDNQLPERWFAFAFHATELGPDAADGAEWTELGDAFRRLRDSDVPVLRGALARIAIHADNDLSAQAEDV